MTDTLCGTLVAQGCNNGGFIRGDRRMRLTNLWLVALLLIVFACHDPVTITPGAIEAVVETGIPPLEVPQ